VTDQRLAVVVLAAGQGTRMRSATPKVLHLLAGRTLIGHVLAAAASLQASVIAVVVRHERDLVAEAVLAELPGALVVDQDEVPGTGRAVELALRALPGGFAGDVLVLSGDVPLLDAGTLRSLIRVHRDTDAAATLLSAVVPDPHGYGRIVRAADGSLERIVEEKDATPEERQIDEVNAGVYVFRAGPLAEALAEVTTDNAQGEKYLTDAIARLREAGHRVGATVAAEAWRVEGVNDPQQLAAAEAAYERFVAG